MTFSRSMSVVVVLAASAVVTVGLAPPVSAAFASEPLSRAWTADGPVHSSLGTSTRVFVGGTFDHGGGVAALNPATGARLWSTPTNGDVRGIALSDDRSTLFVGGAFTRVDGRTHRHLAAIDVASGAVRPKWKASTSGVVRDIVVSGARVYVGGTFAKVGGRAQKGLGAVRATSGKLITGFTGSVDRNVYGLALTSSALIATGSFTSVNGQPRASIASFSLSSNRLTSWAPRRLCSGCNSYWDVVVDGTNAYVGTSGPGGNLGAFDLATGLNPWHYVHADGDVQSVEITGDGLVYLGGHFGQYVGSRLTERTVMAAVDVSNGLVDRTFHPRFYKLYPGMWTITSARRVLYGGGDFAGVGTGPNASNNHVPYLAAFAAR